MTEPRETRSLVQEAQAGSRPAFDALAERFRDRLRARIENWLRYRIGPALDVDDVLQDALLRAFKALEGFTWQGDEAFFGWLCAVAKNALADSARGAARAILGRAGTIRESAVAAPGPTQSQTIRREERFDRLRSALEDLQPDHRQALTLARIEGLTFKEIAARMDRTPNAVKHLIARGLRELRKRFGNTESLHLPPRMMEPEGERHAE